MNTLPPTPPTRGRTRIRWTRVAPAVLVALVLVGGLATFIASRSNGPASPGVVHVGPTPATTGRSPAQTGSTQTKAAAYSACMRSHGAPSFPDPDSQGHLNLKFGKGSQVDPSSPRFQAAQRACRSLAPSQNTSASNSQFAAQALKFAACMRSHGVPNFPDPKGSGAFLIQGIDPNSPQVKSAQQACQSLLPAGGPGGGQ